MSINSLNDRNIVDSWQKNVSAWTVAVRNGQIESSQLVTNQAIIEAILSRSPNSVLDLGCGEGWLTRQLAARKISVMGNEVSIFTL